MKRLRRRAYKPSKLKYRRASIDDGEENMSQCSNSSDDTLQETFFDYQTFSFGVRNRMTSSPVIFSNETDETFEETNSDDSTIHNPLYSGAAISTEDFVSEFMDITTKHNFSDAASHSILTFLTRVLPTPNHCPSYGRLKTLTTTEGEWCEVSKDGGTYYTLNLESQLQKLINKHPYILEDSFEDYPPSDLMRSPCLKNEETSSVKHVYVIVNVDGISSIFQSRQSKIWPILASVLNLHPRFRSRFGNILFCSLYYGASKPDFQFLMTNLVNQVESVNLFVNGLHIRVKLVTLTADLPAKAACLNMTQFNGYYPCNMCQIKGVFSNEFRKMLFPDNQEIAIRTEDSFNCNAAVANDTSTTYFGIKGHSSLSRLIPLSEIPFDSMHLVYLGITRSIILHIIKHQLVDLPSVSLDLVSISIPASFKRKPRSLEYRLKYKASEWKAIILYYFPVFFHCENESLKLLLILLSTIIRILNKWKITSEDCDDAHRLITVFRRLSLQLFGESVESFTMHAFHHMPDQVRRYGALWTTSAFCFESAFYHLKRMLTGTRNEGQLLVKRFVRKMTCSLSQEFNDQSKLSKIVGPVCSVVPSGPYSEYNFVVQGNFAYAYRFSTINGTFSSFSYPLKRSSSSHFALLYDARFVRIDHIFLVGHNEIKCLCTELLKLRPISDDIQSDSNDLISRHCMMFCVTYGDKCICDSSQFSNHLIVLNKDDSLLATPTITTFEPS